jgi:transposase
VVLLAEQGFSNKEIARQLNTNEQRVGRWRNRFAHDGLHGLKEKPGRGAPPTYNTDLRLKVIQEACQPPKETTHWTVRDLRDHVNQKYNVSVSHMFVHRLLQSLDLKPHQHQMWLNSTDPDFKTKKCNIVGLYLNPPENAYVLSVDENPVSRPWGASILPSP